MKSTIPVAARYGIVPNAANFTGQLNTIEITMKTPRWIKRLLCDHQWLLVDIIPVHMINLSAGRRTKFECIHCGKTRLSFAEPPTKRIQSPPPQELPPISMWKHMLDQPDFKVYDDERQAYDALKAYDDEANRLEALGQFGAIKPSLMQSYADRYGTTVEAMKRQWKNLKR